MSAPTQTDLAVFLSATIHGKEIQLYGDAKDGSITFGGSLEFEAHLQDIAKDLWTNFLSLGDEIPGLIDLLPDDAEEITLRLAMMLKKGATGTDGRSTGSKQFELSLLYGSPMKHQGVDLLCEKLDTGGFLVGGEVEAAISLARLPLIGGVKVFQETVIHNIGFFYAGANGDYLVPSLGDDPRAFEKRLSGTGDWSFLGDSKSLIFSVGHAEATKQGSGEKKEEEDSTTTKPDAENRLLAPLAKDQSDTISASILKWIKVRKTFGPVHLERVGLGYDKKKKSVVALIDGGFKLGPVTLKAAGLGGEFAISRHPQLSDITFHLSGLEVDFRRPPLEIDGAFLKLDGDFVGKITVRTEAISFGGLGAYKKILYDVRLVSLSQEEAIPEVGSSLVIVAFDQPVEAAAPQVSATVPAPTGPALTSANPPGDAEPQSPSAGGSAASFHVRIFDDGGERIADKIFAENSIDEKTVAGKKLRELKDQLVPLEKQLADKKEKDPKTSETLDSLATAAARNRILEAATSVAGQSRLQSGTDSLFLYAFVNYPLGGPAFFFLEGLAAGFGINRRLTVPPVDQIAGFPLVSEVVNPSPAAKSGSAGADPQKNAGDDLRAKLGQLETYLAPEEGQYFACAGLKFNSFRILDTFALLSVSFGKHFEIDLFGVSKLQTPPDSKEVLAEIDIQFVARFDPAAGFLGVQADLTPQSFILSKDCHLQGGFAFFSWFKDFGGDIHGGDFVVSAGGYHPKFLRPDHYPVVPRIAFTWKLSDAVQIKGGFYYALTHHALMAGGNLHATYHQGSLRAWFDLDANFLIAWKPFHYTADAHVEIGASLTIHFFGTHHVTISAGAELDIWGPEFAGKAHVHARVIGFKVHFDVNLGDEGKTPLEPIDWTAFQKSFLPTTEAGDPDPSKYGQLKVARGLVRELKDADGKVVATVVNPKELEITFETLIPLNDDHKTVGIGPMGLSSQNFTSGINVNITMDGAADDVRSAFIQKPISKYVPKALWNPVLPAPDPKTKEVSPEANGHLIEASVGCKWTPAKPVAAGESHPIRAGDLAYEPSPSDSHLEVSKTRLVGDLKGAAIATIDSPNPVLLAALGFESTADVSIATKNPKVAAK